MFFQIKLLTILHHDPALNMTKSSATSVLKAPVSTTPTIGPRMFRVVCKAMDIQHNGNHWTVSPVSFYLGPPPAPIIRKQHLCGLVSSKSGARFASCSAPSRFLASKTLNTLVDLYFHEVLLLFFLDTGKM